MPTKVSKDELEQRERDKKAAQERKERDKLLSNTDKTQIPDAPYDAGVWADYRQKLRDITEQSGFPGSIEWPEKPSDL